MDDVHIAHRHGSDVLQVNAQKRPAEDIAVAALLHQKLDGRDDFRTLLYLIKKYQRLPGNERLVSYRGKTQKQVPAVPGVFKQRSRGFIL